MVEDERRPGAWWRRMRWWRLGGLDVARVRLVMRASLKMMRLWIGRCTVEKGSAVIQAREKRQCKGRSCVDGEERTYVPIAQMR